MKRRRQLPLWRVAGIGIPNVAAPYGHRLIPVPFHCFVDESQVVGKGFLSLDVRGSFNSNLSAYTADLFTHVGLLSSAGPAGDNGDQNIATITTFGGLMAGGHVEIKTSDTGDTSFFEWITELSYMNTRLYSTAGGGVNHDWICIDLSYAVDEPDVSVFVMNQSAIDLPWPTTAAVNANTSYDDAPLLAKMRLGNPTASSVGVIDAAIGAAFAGNPIDLGTTDIERGYCQITLRDIVQTGGVLTSEADLAVYELFAIVGDIAANNPLREIDPNAPATLTKVWPRRLGCFITMPGGWYKVGRTAQLLARNAPTSGSQALSNTELGIKTVESSVVPIPPGAVALGIRAVSGQVNGLAPDVRTRVNINVW